MSVGDNVVLWEKDVRAILRLFVASGGPCCGTVEVAPDGDWVHVFGVMPYDGVYIEPFHRETGARVLRFDRETAGQ